MPKAAPDPQSIPAHRGFAAVPLALLFLVAATIASYCNSLDGPFIFDDVSAIYENPTIRDLSRIGDILRPPSDSGVTVNGRPLVNLSLALNYAIGGTAVRGYHLVNAGIHVLAVLTMFGVVRRLAAQRLGRALEDRTIVLMGTTLAAVWALHPLQTQSVTYVVQRAEASVGLFYLLTLYTFARSQTKPDSRFWPVAAVTSSLLGVASKEVIVSAPIVVLLCDRTFFAGSFTAAWRRNRWLHLALFASWIPLAWQIHAAGGRGGTVGFGIDGVTWWMYLFTQADALTRYLFTTLWPHRLVFDYGVGMAQSIVPVWPQMLLIVSLFVATVYTLFRAPLIGFLGACFFLILAPSSSVVPIVTESMAEHRMYLPLAAVTGLLALACFRLTGRRTWYALLAAAVAFGLLTIRRNRDYRSDMEIWRSTVSHYPQSARAHNNYGEALARVRRYEEAVAQYREAIRLLPNYRDALCNLGAVLHRVGQQKEGMEILSMLVRRFPNVHEILGAYGGACYREGREEEAKQYFERAVALSHYDPESNNNLAVILNNRGQPREAIKHLERALVVRPNYTDATYNYAISLSQLGDTAGAVAKLRQTLAIDAEYPEANNNLGAILYEKGQRAEARRLFELAVRTKPTYADALSNLGVLTLEEGRGAAAIDFLERAIKADPKHPTARTNLELARRALASGEASKP